MARQITNVTDSLLDELSQIPPCYDGEWRIEGKKCKKRIKMIAITRGEEFKSWIHFSEATAYMDPIEKRVRKKMLKKHYKTDDSIAIELLAYYDWQERDIEPDHLSELHHNLEDDFENSLFRRVWIYDRAKGEVWTLFAR